MQKTEGIFSEACYKVTEASRGSSVNSDVDIYNLEVTYFSETGKNKKYDVQMFYYKNWPDGAIPPNPENFEDLIDYLNKKRLTKLAVHCHAGAGRTGVFCACMYAPKTGEGNPVKIIEKLR